VIPTGITSPTEALKEQAMFRKHTHWARIAIATALAIGTSASRWRTTQHEPVAAYFIGTPQRPNLATESRAHDTDIRKDARSKRQPRRAKVSQRALPGAHADADIQRQGA
jgi:hypothetical protein